MDHDPRLRTAEAEHGGPSPTVASLGAQPVLAGLLAAHGNQEVLGALALGGSQQPAAGWESTPQPGVSGAEADLAHHASLLGAEAFAPGLTPAASGEVEAAATPDVSGGDPKKVRVVEKAIHAAEGLAGEGVRRTKPRNEKDRAVAAYNLLSEGEEHLAKARSVLEATGEGLSGVVSVVIDPFHIPTLKESVLGWVGRFLGEWVTNIHVTPRFFEQSTGIQAWAILHEATHLYGDAEDHAYYDGHLRRPDGLTADQAVENADSLAAFSYGLVGGDGAGRVREGEKKAAEEHAAELFDLWAAGEIELFTDGWVAPDGLGIPAATVAEAVFGHFRSAREEEYGEVAVATAEQEEGPFTCSSGLVVRKDLFEMVYAEEQGFESWR